MYLELNLPGRVREWLDEFKTTHDNVPIRFLRGNAHNFEPPTSWRGAAGPNRTSLSDCEERGLTIVNWATDRIRPGTGWQYTEIAPSGLFRDENSRSLAMEVVLPASDLNDPDSHFVPASDFDNGNMTYARVGERCVWYCINLAHLFDHYPDAVDLDKILGEPLEAALDPEREIRRREREIQLAHDRFVESALNRSQNALREAQVRVNALEVTLNRLEQEHQSTLTELRDSARSIEIHEQSLSRDNEYLETQWNALISHPRVENVSVVNDNIVINTGEFDLHHPSTGASVPLGKFNITIPTTNTGHIYIANTTNAKEGRDHPHVSNNNPCWGDSEALIAELRAAGEISGLIEVIFQYLETYNPRDYWGRFARLWDTENALGTH